MTQHHVKVFISYIVVLVLCVFLWLVSQNQLISTVSAEDVWRRVRCCYSLDGYMDLRRATVELNHMPALFTGTRVVFFECSMSFICLGDTQFTSTAQARQHLNTTRHDRCDKKLR